MNTLIQEQHTNVPIIHREICQSVEILLSCSQTSKKKKETLTPNYKPSKWPGVNSNRYTKEHRMRRANWLSVQETTRLGNSNGSNIQAQLIKDLILTKHA